MKSKIEFPYFLKELVKISQIKHKYKVGDKVEYRYTRNDLVFTSVGYITAVENYPIHPYRINGNLYADCNVTDIHCIIRKV